MGELKDIIEGLYNNDERLVKRISILENRIDSLEKSVISLLEALSGR